jgi:hypothetical protein
LKFILAQGSRRMISVGPRLMRDVGEMQVGA